MSRVEPIYLKDYTEPSYLVEYINLTFELDDRHTVVSSEMSLKYNTGERKVRLYGKNLELAEIALNGQVLEQSAYHLDEQGIVLNDTPEQCLIRIKNIINPEENKTMEGLYKSGGIFCTQCEPEGFRTITYYPDRPDVMSKFTTKIIADKQQYPILLSNGNPIERGELDGGKHFVVWEDPFAKPSYLFALVAGDLGVIKDTYTTSFTKKEKKLEIYCDKGNEDKCYHAMESLKNAMLWDEQTFGLEYDLDIYMIVAVDSFNMGAMENKGLNIFNSKYVLADKKTATDQDFLGVEGVIGHEYFHNWTGNRVTCKNWFQLTLKEGLTVFRDQEFSADMMKARAVKRIEDVQRLKLAQFVEDAGPTAHPIKPKEYVEMNNFYTATVYEKGAEVIRMIETFLGRDGFRKGMDLYFERHDGQAVTTEDFVSAMSDANNYDFSQFEKSWYNRAGTPTLHVTTNYDEQTEQLTMLVKQSCQETKGVESTPFHLPLALGLLDAKGEDMPLVLKDSTGQDLLERGILHIRHNEQEFVFVGIKEKPAISLNRGFRAPVIIDYDYSFSDLAFLLSHDSDDYNRYDAMQELSKRLIQDLVKANIAGEELKIPTIYDEAFAGVLSSSISDAIKSYCLKLPAISILKLDYNPIPFSDLLKVHKFIKRHLAEKFSDQLYALYKDSIEEGHSLDALSIGKRMLKNMTLSYLAKLEKYEQTVVEHFSNATNMTDEISALSFIANSTYQGKQELLDKFIAKYKDEKLVVDKWFSVQAMAESDDTLEVVKSLLNNPLYDKTNPNSVRSVIGAFIGNYASFHTATGYEFVVDQIISIDKMNPQLASRLVMGFRDFKKLPTELKSLMQSQLDRLNAQSDLSKNTLEILGKILA